MYVVEAMTSPPADMFEKRVRDWYQENSNTREVARLTNNLKPWTVKSLYAALYKSHINTVISRIDPEAVPGSTRYLKLYQPALKAALQQLSETERKDLEKACEDYNTSGAPPELRKK